MKKNWMLFISLPFLLNSCLLTPTTYMPEKIIKNNTGVADVGIIFDWTNSDYKFIALELKLERGRKLFLTFVNWRKKPRRQPFYLGSIGDYSFTRIYYFVNKHTKETYRISFWEGECYSLPYLSKKIGVQLKTIQDLITYYDNIYAFVESLPLINNEDDFQKMLKAGNLIRDNGYETKDCFVTIYYVRTIWNDECYGEEWKNGKPQPRRPDYYNGHVQCPWPRAGWPRTVPGTTFL